MPGRHPLPGAQRQGEFRMKSKKSNFITIFLFLMLLAGLSLLLYPSISDYWNSFHSSRAISEYAENVAEMDTEQYDEMWSAAWEYNQSLLARSTGFTLSDEQKQEYESLLDVSGLGIMGYVEIPEISASLPIYHGTEESVLQVAVGHLEWSSLPVGGESSHCVLSGHRALPSAKLFTDLDKLREGDIFLLRVLDEVLTYEVDQILIVEPQNTASLQIVEGKDLCTLVTCTPYGVNTHRLLVRGHRIPAEAAEKPVQVTVTQQVVHSLGWKGKLLIGALLLFLLILLILALLRRKKKKDKPEEDRKERGSANEISYQNGSGTADASAAVSPRDGPPR